MIGSVTVAFEAAPLIDKLPPHHQPRHLLDDEQLVVACLAGDEEAWGALLDRYSRLIYTVPLRFGFPAAIAEEIFQEVCLILLEKLTTLRDHRRFSTWLVTVTRRACLQRLRYQKETQSLELLEETAAAPHTPEAALLLLEEQDIVHRAVAKLDGRCRHLVRALFFDAISPSYAEIADTLQMPEGSIGPTRARCLEKLRHLLLNESADKGVDHGAN
ncbi:MAG: sigma-70 family RNA polymerase sigma factor [Caldilinea sp. CFX5]|nr:sigma-70 family RNA polymerase sigma factor [Caldilinea sp. CFX5]